MNFPNRFLLSTITLCFCAGVVSAQSEKESHKQKELPSVADFKPEKYLGKWYEAARMPTAMQPRGSLAIAEYSLDEKTGNVVVKNTLYDANGEKVTSITGKAKLAEGKPPGRFYVSFGPIKTSKPNYYVMHVDKEYQFAVVGTPNRKSLWILVRKVPVSEEKLKSLIGIARKSGFDVAKLNIADWKRARKSDK